LGISQDFEGLRQVAEVYGHFGLADDDSLCDGLDNGPLLVEPEAWEARVEIRGL
jgi:hypothetical protein